MDPEESVAELTVEQPTVESVAEHTVEQRTVEPVAEPTVEPRTVELVAPSNLNEGYEFYVVTGRDASCRVRVPEGGVQHGQRFFATVVSDDAPSGPHNIPFGRWRDGLCDCFSLGICHPLLCMTFFCASCGLGQVLTRMNLSFIGSPATNPGTATVSACRVLGVATVLISAAQALLPLYFTSVQSFFFLVQGLLSLFGVVVTMRLRAHVRNRYNIPERHIWGFDEDCLYSYCCLACSICQISRHTADFSKYRAGCCTENGLRAGDPVPV